MRLRPKDETSDSKRKAQKNFFSHTVRFSKKFEASQTFQMFDVRCSSNSLSKNVFQYLVDRFTFPLFFQLFNSISSHENSLSINLLSLPTQRPHGKQKRRESQVTKQQSIEHQRMFQLVFG